MQIKSLGQGLQVILSVYQVLNRHLTQTEKLYKVGIAETFKVFSVEISIRQILKKLLELTQISGADDLFDIGVHDEAPVDSALSCLESEFWRQWHQMAELKVFARFSDRSYESIGAHCSFGQPTH